MRGISVHMHRRQYIFSNINENKISDRETPVELSSLEPQYGAEPLLISFIGIIRHSGLGLLIPMGWMCLFKIQIFMSQESRRGYIFIT